MESLELSTSLRTVVAELHKCLRKQMYAVDSYSMTEMGTVGHLMRNDALLPSELAMLMRVKTQSMSQIIKKLEEQGVVKRTPSKDDKRKVYISITAKGKKMVEQTRYDKDEWLKAAIERSLTCKETDLIAKVIPVLNKLIETK